MSLRKRISSSLERSAQARAKRREERRRAERAKQTATASQRAKARSDRRAEADAEKTKAKAAAGAKGRASAKAKPKVTASRARPAEGKRSSPKALASKGPAAKRPAAAERGRAVVADARKLGGGVASVAGEVLKLGREMVAIPVQLWLAGAEIAGAFVLKVWLRGLRPLLLWLWRLARAILRVAERHVTPARGVAAVAVVAIGALAASQWLDYHAVTVGTDAYSDAVGAVAPPPEVESEVAGNAHGWVMIPLAVAALVALALALSGRRRVALLLVPIGIVAIVIALAVDVPKGLDEGTAAVAYEGASASLLEGFWLQLAAAVVLIACGLLLPLHLRPRAARSADAFGLTGPSLFEKLAASVRKGAARRPTLKRKLPRPRPKRKVQGAGT
jgi:hypothetical protein